MSKIAVFFCEKDGKIYEKSGDVDNNIRFEYGEQLFENLGSKEKEFFAVKGGGHFDLSEKGGVLYETHLMDFVEKQFNQ